MNSQNTQHSPKYEIGENSKGYKYKYVEIDEDYTIIPIETSYIQPNEPLDKIINPSINILEDGDYLVISETPVAISQGRLVDEMDYTPGISAKFLAVVWSKYIWGYILGPILRIKKRTIKNLRRLPEESKRHKEVVLQLYGWKHGLKPASEAGIDLSNAPGTLVSLLPKKPNHTAKKIAKTVENKSNVKTNVLIIDTDATYKFRNKYFTGLPTAIEGISANNGVFAYFFGQIFTNAGHTPLGTSSPITVKKGIKIANMVEDYQKSLSTSMETIYSSNNVLGTVTNEISIDELDCIVHTPAVIVRKNKTENNNTKYH